MTSLSDAPLLLGLFAVPAAALLWAAVRMHYRAARGKESGRLKLDDAEIAAGAAALAAVFGFAY